MKNRLVKRVSFLVLLAAIALVIPATGFAKQKVVLNFSHLFPEVSWMHQQVVIPWKKMVEDKSNGRLQVNIFPSASLAKPGMMYDAVKMGMADICLDPGPYYWGRFLMSEATQLPFLGARSSLSGSLTWMDLLEKYPQFRKEYEETHLLWLFAQGPGQLITNKPVHTMNDMKGMIVRGPGAQGDFVKAVGGSPVSMPSPETYLALSKGTLDATTFPGEAMRTWRLYEVTKYVVMGDFYVQWFIVAMNQNKYNSLPRDLQKVIDECSGKTGAELTARAWDRADREGFELAREKGVQFIHLEESEMEKWRKACEPLTQKWIERMSAKGYPAEAFIRDAKSLIQKYNKL